MISQGEGCSEDVGVGWQQTRQRYDKSPASKIYTTWVYILSDRNVFCPPRGGGKTVGSNAPWAFLVFRVLPLHHFFFHGDLPQTSGFRRPNKYSLQTSTIRLERVSLVTVIYFAPERRENNGGV